MSEELKTLKDMETKSVVLEGFCIDETQENIVESYELRQEVIKHIKALNTKNNYDFYCDECHHDTVIEWIKYFFNITEEELK